MIQAWYDKTPPGFVFAAKVPQIVTHDKVLVDCAAEMRHFLGAMGGLTAFDRILESGAAPAGSADAPGEPGAKQS